MSSPRVHILLPTYEPHEAYLRDAISSAQAQTCTDWTMLVHDDASHTDVRTIIEPFLEDRRITFVRSKTRRGIGGNWNACLAHASAPYVQFLFQDDLWEPSYLERCLSALEGHTDAAMVSADHVYRSEESALPHSYAHVLDARKDLAEGKHDGKELLLQWIERGLHPNIIGEPPFVMMRTEAVRKAGRFHPTMRQGLDSEYWIRLLLQGDIVILKDSLGTFQVHGAAASAANERSGEGLFDRLLCFRTAVRALPKEHKKHARQSRDLHFRMMVGKFLRRNTGDAQAGEGASAGKKITSLIRFTLRHPLLLLSCTVRQPFVSVPRS